MTKQIHIHAWFRRGQATNRQSASGNTSRVRRLQVETLEDRSLLSGNAAADVTAGGTVELDAAFGFNTTCLATTADDSWAGLGADALDCRVAESIVSSSGTARYDGANDDSGRIQAAAGDLVQTIAPNDLPSMSQVAGSAGDELDSDAFDGFSDRTPGIGSASATGDAHSVVGPDTISEPWTHGPRRNADGGWTDVTSLADHSDPVTKGGWVDITPRFSEPDLLAGSFREHASPFGLRLAKRPDAPAGDNSPAPDVLMEGAGGRSQAFEVAMLSDLRIDENHALRHADRGAPSDNGAIPAKSPSATDLWHKAVSRDYPHEAIETVSYAAEIGSRSEVGQPRAARSHPGGPDYAPAKRTAGDRSAENPATLAARASDSGFDGQQLAFAKEEDWSHGDFDWLTVNVHKERQAHVIALVAATLVTLRSPGWYLPFRDERQTFLTPPPERLKTDS